jgi:hypothetical protein
MLRPAHRKCLGKVQVGRRLAHRPAGVLGRAILPDALQDSVRRRRLWLRACTLKDMLIVVMTNCHSEPADPAKSGHVGYRCPGAGSHQELTWVRCSRCRCRHCLPDSHRAAGPAATASCCCCRRHRHWRLVPRASSRPTAGCSCSGCFWPAVACILLPPPQPLGAAAVRRPRWPQVCIGSNQAP